MLYSLLRTLSENFFPRREDRDDRTIRQENPHKPHQRKLHFHHKLNEKGFGPECGSYDKVLQIIFFMVTEPRLYDYRDHITRQKTMYSCMLTCRAAAAIIEPLLYKQVVLETRKQTMGFLQTLSLKPEAFLARTVKNLWIIDDVTVISQDLSFSPVFRVCPNIKRLVLYGSGVKVLEKGPRFSRQWTQPRCQKLMLIQPDPTRDFSLSGLELEKLHIIDPSEQFLSRLNERMENDDDFFCQMRDISRVTIEFTVAPSRRVTKELIIGTIPNLLDMQENSMLVWIKARWVVMDSDSDVARYSVQSWVYRFPSHYDTSSLRVHAYIPSPEERASERELTQLELAKKAVLATHIF